MTVMQSGKVVERICIVGGGSAGYLAAVTLRRLLPGRKVVLVQSQTKPVIGVGESTTAYFPLFLHRQLGLDFARFYSEVRPSWKLGIRFVWGPIDKGHFNYPFSFDLSRRNDPLRKRAAYYCLEQSGQSGVSSALMDGDLSPLVRDDQGQHHLLNRPFGYHIDNSRFLSYLDSIAKEWGVEFIVGDVEQIIRDGDLIAELRLNNGRRINADLFIDCSGFSSLLLGKTLGERFVRYQDELPCDSAIVGSYQRDETIKPYTTAETMDSGWCWGIDLPEHVTVGYVHCSDFCSTDEAIAELKSKRPQLGDDLRAIKFPSGRYENFWRSNVMAVGNASGFVEPLESTALHVIADQLIQICGALLDSDYRLEQGVRDAMNERFRQTWDSIRDFLFIHYKFNRRLKTPFWKHCNAQPCPDEAARLVDAFVRLGPHSVCQELFSQNEVVQFEGYLALLIGQHVQTNSTSLLDEQDLIDWRKYQEMISQTVQYAIPVREALEVVSRPSWQWS